MSRTIRRIKKSFKFYHAMDFFIEKARNNQQLSSDEKEFVNKYFRDTKLKYFISKCGCWFCESGKFKNYIRKEKLIKQIEKENKNLLNFYYEMI